MKKTFIRILLILSCIGFGAISSVNVYAGDAGDDEVNIVEVTEKIPGADCTDITKKEGGKDVPTGFYKCKIGRGFSSIMVIMGKILKYFTFIAGLFSVLALVIGGIMYSMGGADENLKTKSKEFITKSLLGLIVLLLSGLILYAVAPWVYV